MSLRRCAACGSPNVVSATEQGGYSYTKGAIGTVLFGTGGAVAGINGKTTQVYKCPDCGLTLDHLMHDELRVLIDAGVRSVEARKNLKLRGATMYWDVLRSSYKNIESGAADRELEAQLKKITSIATATKQEFDSAIDIISEKLYRKFGYYDSREPDIYTTNNPMTLQEYREICSAIYTFVENVYMQLTPDSKGYIDRGYRNMPPVFPIACLLDYCILRFYALNSRLPFHNYTDGHLLILKPECLPGKSAQKVSKINNDFDSLLYNFPFLKGLIEKCGRTFDILSPDRPNTLYQYLSLSKETKIVNKTEKSRLFVICSWNVDEETKVNFLLPRYKEENGKLYYSNVAFAKNSAYSPVNCKDLMDAYFAKYPEKKEIYENSINQAIERQHLSTEEIKRLQTIIGNLEQCHTEISCNNNQIQNNNIIIGKLKKKIFGKKNAALEIAEMEKKNAALRVENQRLNSMLAEMDSLKKQLDIIKESRIPMDAAWYERLAQAMDYFIVWHCIDGSKEVNKNDNTSK